MITFSSLPSGLKATDGKATLVVFPQKATDANIITLLSLPEEEPKKGTISWPGEYNLQSVTMRGIAHRDGQQVSFLVIMDDVRILFLSSALQDWTDTQVESVGNIDVMVMPMEDPRLAQKLVDQFDPRVIILIPTEDTEAYSAIYKAIGVKEEGVMAEYKLKGQLPQEGRDVVVLTK